MISCITELAFVSFLKNNDDWIKRVIIDLRFGGKEAAPEGTFRMLQMNRKDKVRRVWTHDQEGSLLIRCNLGAR